MRISNIGFTGSYAPTMNKDFQWHKTDGNKGNGEISYSSGKKPLTGEKLPLNKVNNNIKVSFYSPLAGFSPKIMCCHFTLYALVQRLKNSQFKIYDAFKDEKTIFSKLGKIQKDLVSHYNNAYKIADTVYILRHDSKYSDWPTFLKAQFAILEEGGKGDRFFCFLNTFNHSMLLEGVTGQSRTRERFYRLKFYDPNQTVLTQSVESISLDALCKKSLKDFLSAKDLNCYQADLVAAAVYQQNNHWQVKAQPVFKMQFENEHLTPKILLMVSAWGITSGVEKLLELTASLDRDAAFKLLMAKNLIGRSALFLAMEHNRDETVALLTDWIINHKDFTSDEIFQLLLAKAEREERLSPGEERHAGGTGLHTALSLGHNQSVKVFIDTCIRAFKHDKINIDQLELLLSAKDDRHIPGLFFALKCGHLTSITTFMEAVINISQPRLADETIVKLFLAEGEQKEFGILSAVQRGHLDSVKAFIDQCRRVFNQRRITQTQLISLLNVKDAQGRSFFHFVLRNSRYAEEIPFFMEAVLSIPDLSSEMVKEIFIAKDDKKESGLYWAINGEYRDKINNFFNKCREAVAKNKLTVAHFKEIEAIHLELVKKQEVLQKAQEINKKIWNSDYSLDFALENDRHQMIATFMDAVINIPESLDKAVVENIFLAATDDGAPGLQLALQNGNAKSVKAFIDGCAQALEEDKIDLTQLITLLSAQDKSDVPGLSIALQAGKDKAVTAFMEAVLEIDQVDRAAVEKLFLGESDRWEDSVRLALANGHEHAVAAFIEGCRQAREQGKFSQETLASIIKLRDDLRPAY
jgi:hypothetical protein